MENAHRGLKGRIEEMAELKDTGNRRDFGTGAVRDMAEGKGRCDLLPLDIVWQLFPEGDDRRDVFYHLNRYQETKKAKHLRELIDKFAETDFGGISDMLLEVAVHFEDGARKYGDNNWRNGIPCRCYLDSAIRHYLKYCRGDEDEPHRRAFVWNILCCLWTQEHYGYDLEGLKNDTIAKEQ